ncbi:hypothetical protein [Sphingomonas sp. LaA6.9]|uniref:hypothetical protein n=1 Tax=Sphingomonas sp. LaA6.9 TaxID=2919914 RepID=UPI001F4FFC2A|nr:hypothetical protein [Sphingomonas sp. LaA6.9]MCJ8157601.1 hypothetical protein [Sphingomonas sp. LaA6.9]
MASIKRISSIFLAGCALSTLAACGGADDVASPGDGVIITPTPTPPQTPTPTPPQTPGQPAASCPTGFTDGGVIGSRRACQLPSRFTQDTTLQNVPGVAYSIVGAVNVGTDVGGDGTAAGGQPVTLSIQAGTVLFGSAGNDYLVVNRGSRLQAVGTATNPIIFTARANLAGTTTDSSMGLWGGVVLLGRAPISDCNTAVAGGTAGCQQVIEGTTGSLYGGATANDNSGTLQYVQIRYSGFAIAPGNELQGLTLGGVGNNTTIDHIQIHNSSDDGIEIFGGRSNLKHLVITGADDDNLDTDLGYRGTIQFVIGIQKPGGDGDSMIEADSNGNEDALPRQYTRVSNATFVQSHTSSGGNAILMRGGTDYALLNSVVVTPQACLDIDETAGTTTRAADAALQDLGAPVFRSVVMQCGTAIRADGNEAAVTTIFGTGTNNNNSAFTASLANVFVNGAAETGVTATDPTTFNADQFATVNAAAPNRLTAVTYIGAVRDANDTWYAGWTCTSGYANFGATSAACTAIPTT